MSRVGGDLHSSENEKAFRSDNTGNEPGRSHGMMLSKADSVQSQLVGSPDQVFRLQMIVVRVLAVAVKIDEHREESRLIPGTFRQARLLDEAADPTNDTAPVHAGR